MPPVTAPRKHEAALRAAGCQLVAGVDEVGRGALAGPVVVAAVILPPRPIIQGVTDSKLLAAARREELAEAIRERALAFAIVAVSHDIIDATNILQATHVGMRNALQQLQPAPDHALIDGRPVPELPVASTAIVGGDRQCYSIAAASIIAKVHRDRILELLDELYPGYGLGEHKGYGAQGHIEAIARLGPSAIHRKSFGPCREPIQSGFDFGESADA